jgi:hypothetical protein
MVTFLFFAVLAILGFLCFAAQAVISARGAVTESSSRQKRAVCRACCRGNMFDRIAFVVTEQIQKGER